MISLRFRGFYVLIFAVIGLNIIMISAIFRVYCFISLTKVQLLPGGKFYFILITFQWQIQSFR